MKKTVFALFLCVSVITTGFSQTKKESIKELFHVMKTDSMMSKMIDSMVPAMLSQMQSQMSDSTAKARSTELMTSMMETVKGFTPRMQEEMVSLYDKYFSDKEIQDYITFYKSPSGQKIISLMPEITKDMMGNMMQTLVPELQNTIKAKMEEMKNSEKK